LSKNAIFCAEDLFLKCGPELNLSQKACDALAGALLDTCASNMPKALRTAAATALEQGVTTGPLMKLIPALAVKANAKNADVAEAAMVFAEKACKAVSAQVRINRGGCRSIWRGHSHLIIASLTKTPVGAGVGYMCSCSETSPLSSLSLWPLACLFQGVSIWAKELDLGRLIPALSFGINAKSAKTKKAAKSVCMLVSNSISQVYVKSLSFSTCSYNRPK